MKTLYLSFMVSAVVISLSFGLQQSHADDANGIFIQNISVQPYAVKVGDSFTVTATLANNSPIPIVIESGTCSPTDTQIQFFTIVLDNHTTTKSKNLTCAGVGLMKILNSGGKLTGTSPDSTFSYIATKSGTANVTVTFQYAVKNQADSTQPNIEHVISKSLLFVISDNNTGISIPHHGGPPVSSISTPLKQFKSGVKINEIHCPVGLQLVVKSSNNSPACVKPEHVTRLVQNGWTLSDPFNRIADTDILSAKTYNLKQVHYYDSSNLNPKVSLYDYSYDGIDKDGLVSINNQTFYQTTLNNDIYKLKGMSMQFHNITFSFPEGTLITPGGAFVNLDIKFKDGLEEIYGGTTLVQNGTVTKISGIPIPTQYGPHVATNSITILGNHTIPQAGITIYHDKIKLLVSVDQLLTGESDRKYGTLSGIVVLAGGPRSLGPKSNYEVDVYATDGTTVVGKTFSDANAHYSIHLLAGNYTVYVPDYPDKQTHFVSVFPGKNTIFNIAYGTGYK